MTRNNASMCCIIEGANTCSTGAVSTPLPARQIDNRHVICDVFVGSPALYERHLRYLEMLRLVTLLDKGVLGLTREGQSAPIVLELTRRGSGIYFDPTTLRHQQEQDKWITVDPSRWATGLLATSKDDND